MKIKEVNYPHIKHNFYELHWIITRRCPFSCPYCPSHRHDPKSFQAEKKSLVDAVSKLNHIIHKRKIRLNLTGGEPTYHPAFIDFITKALNVGNIYSIRIVSNLSCSEEICKSLNKISKRTDKKILFVTSFHREQSSPIKFLKKLKLLLGSKIEINVKIMLDSKTKDKFSILIDGVRELSRFNDNIVIGMQQIRNQENIGFDFTEFKSKYFEQAARWGDIREITYTNGETKITSNIDSLIKKRLNRFFRWKCYSGANSLFIDNDGNIYSSICKPETKPIGNIFNDKKIKIPKFVICPHETCECGATIRIPKIYEDLYCQK